LIHLDPPHRIRVVQVGFLPILEGDDLPVILELLDCPVNPIKGVLELGLIHHSLLPLQLVPKFILVHHIMLGLSSWGDGEN